MCLFPLLYCVLKQIDSISAWENILWGVGTEREVIPSGFVSASSSLWEWIFTHHCQDTAYTLQCLQWISSPFRSVLSCKRLWVTNWQESHFSTTACVPVRSCSLVHRPLKEKGLHLPRGAETPNTEETSRAERLVRWREWSEEFPSVSALHLTAEVSEVIVSFLSNDF